MPSESTVVLVERRGPVGVAILNRPEKLNAMNAELSAALIEAIDDFEADDQILAIVLTGAGERAFSAGGDMTEVRHRLGPNASRSAGPSVGGRVRECRKPTLAAIRGYCYGGAANTVINCDIRICGDDAKFRFIAASYGLPAAGAMLPRIVGEAKAKELLFTTDVVDAAEALRIGLANQVVPPAEVLDYTVAMAERIAGNSPGAVAAIKQIINVALPVDAAVAREVELSRDLSASDDTAGRFHSAAARVVGR
jgi:enoyl-CoA hydratase